MQSLSKEILKKIWNYDSFLENQEEIIQSILEKRDTLAILPTGAGKSLCYQIPAILKEGLCLVVSPLVALMKEQVKELIKKEVKAEYITAEFSQQEIDVIIDKCIHNQVKLLYVSPERLQNQAFQKQLALLDLSFVAVDEAHCISEWGHDFRPSYLQIHGIKNQFPNLSFLALTATANKETEKEIVDKLKLHNPKIIRDSIERKNLAYRIQKSETIKQDITLELLKEPFSSIVFTRSRKSTYEITNYLQQEGVDAEFFHARLNPIEKTEKQTYWMQSNQQIMVSTIAFGMGINKNNVRKIIHYHLPSSIENYIQEVGRAGRDGKPAVGILYYNQSSIEMTKELFNTQLATKKQFIQITKQLYDYFVIVEGEKPKEALQFAFYELYQKININKKKIKSVLNFLHAKEVVYLQEYRKKSKVQILISPKQVTYQSYEFQDVLEYCIRQYSGILSEMQTVSEYNMSKALNKSTKYVVERLMKMNEQKIIRYINRTRTTIRFLIPRENNRIENVYWKWYKTLQKRKNQRLQDFLYFVQQDKHCRQLLIKRYFGEKDITKCGKCDVCSKHFEETKFNLATELLQFLTPEPKSSYQIQKQFLRFHKNQIIQQLQLLIDEGNVTNIDVDTFQTKLS